MNLAAFDNAFAAEPDPWLAVEPPAGSQIEVRGWQVNPSDGRTAGLTAATLGLSSSDAEVLGFVQVAEPDSYAALRAEVTALIEYPWERNLPGWTVQFRADEGGLRGVTKSGEQHIDVFVRETDSVEWLARILAHELGHAVDLTHNSASDRDRWAATRGLESSVSWWPESGVADFSTGAGDFAECFASWQVGAETLSQVAGPCTALDEAVMVELSTVAGS